MNSTQLKESLSQKLQDSVTKLTYIFEMQKTEFWYTNVARVKKTDIIYINTEFVKKISDEFLDLSLILGDYFIKNVHNLNDFTIELYKFNETLTRLLNKGNQFSSGEYKTNFQEYDEHCSIGLDSNLVMRTVVLTLITKLEKLNELIKENTIILTTIQSQLIDDVLEKNIGQRILEPYHSLLISRIQNNMSKVIHDY